MADHHAATVALGLDGLSADAYHTGRLISCARQHAGLSCSPQPSSLGASKIRTSALGCHPVPPVPESGTTTAPYHRLEDAISWRRIRVVLCGSLSPLRSVTAWVICGAVSLLPTERCHDRRVLWLTIRDSLGPKRDIRLVNSSPGDGVRPLGSCVSSGPQQVNDRLRMRPPRHRSRGSCRTWIRSLPLLVGRGGQPRRQRSEPPRWNHRSDRRPTTESSSHWGHPESQRSCRPPEHHARWRASSAPLVLARLSREWRNRPSAGHPPSSTGSTWPARDPRSRATGHPTTVPDTRQFPTRSDLSGQRDPSGVVVGLTETGHRGRQCLLGPGGSARCEPEDTEIPVVVQGRHDRVRRPSSSTTRRTA